MAQPVRNRKRTRIELREYPDRDHAKHVSVQVQVRPSISKPIRTNSVHLYESNLAYLDRYTHTRQDLTFLFLLRSRVSC